MLPLQRHAHARQAAERARYSLHPVPQRDPVFLAEVPHTLHLRLIRRGEVGTAAEKLRQDVLKSVEHHPPRGHALPAAPLHVPKSPHFP